MKSIACAFCWFVIASCVTGVAQTKSTPAGKPKTVAPQKSDPLQGSPKIVTATKGVEQFWTLEKVLAAAFVKNDKAVIGKLLNDDFKVWLPNQTGSAVGREDWLASGRENPEPVRVAQMAVQFYQDVAVVKFLGSGKTPASGKGGPRQYFVVDLWEKNDTGWELTNRYMSTIAPVALPKTPTGKE